VVSKLCFKGAHKEYLKSLPVLGGKFERALATDFRAGTCFAQCLSPELAEGWESQVERLQSRGRRDSWEEWKGRRPEFSS
jgi:hypothetical protein